MGKRAVLVFGLCVLVILHNAAKNKLDDFCHNVFSQFGEDGIIEKIFEAIGTKSKLCLEVGAADGLSCSNTANLWINHGWRAVLIEHDKQLFSFLLKNIAKYNGNCIAVNQTIGIEQQYSIDDILRSFGIEARLDLVSIDIDGNDYYIVLHMNMHPRVLICEFNPTIPFHIDVYQNYGQEKLGASVAALVRILKPKSYTLVALTRCNCIFVDDAEMGKLNDFELLFHEIASKDIAAHVCETYDGKVFLLSRDSQILPWGTKKSYRGKVNTDGIMRRISPFIMEKFS